jgi:transcriptional regulator
VYIPKFNEENDISVLHSLIKTHPLGTWASMSKGEIVVNHIPFVLHQERGELGTLVGHVARANPIWQDCSAELDSVIIFQSDQAYITPSWYPSKHKHGKAVPTWNYAVVHAHGKPKIIEDSKWLLEHVNELTDIHESQQNLPWKVSDAPEDYIEKLIGAIVGIEIPVNKLTGKWKLGQNRPEPDKLGTVAGLMSRDDPQSHGLAHLLNKHIQTNDKGSQICSQGA